MNLFQRFENFISVELKLNSSHRFLIAVSGGMDSMTLLHLFGKTKNKIAVAHCNFGLRGEESDFDHRFVKHHCSANNIPLFEKKIDLKKYDGKLSIQEEARRTRYEWFEEIRNTNSFDFIVTAHHLNDVAETVLLNIARGTGIAGLHGIKAMNNKIIRPVIFLTRNEIENYAKENQISFREDSSNKKNNYSRNKIRNLVIPVLKEVNPELETHIDFLTKQISFAENIYRKHLSEIWNNIHSVNGDTIEILISKLNQLNDLHFYLYEFLNPFGFNFSQVNNIIESLEEQSGKQFHSANFELLKDRQKLLLRKIELKDDDEYLIEEDCLRFETENEIILFEHLANSSEISFDKNIFLLDKNKIQFPMILRKWKQGDRFVPLGMKEKKKVSDFFIDAKVNLIEKKQSIILTGSDSEILALLPHRIDERFKITTDSKNILKITVVPKKNSSGK